MELARSVNKHLSALPLVIGVVLFVLWSTPSSAQEQASATVSSNSPFPLLIDGIPTEEFPAPVPPGALVCNDRDLQYLGTGERWAFQEWSHGPTEDCVTLPGPGSYRAIYTHEVLLQVRSTVTSVQDSRWVELGVQETVEVPETVEEDAGIRYTFFEWSGGESPFDPENVIAPLVPTVLEPIWIREYLITVVGAEGLDSEGSGWIPDGGTAVIRAQDVQDVVPGAERFKFASWQFVSGTALAIDDVQSPIANVVVTGPATFKAAYERQFFVVATAPSGTLKRGWIAEGEELVFDAPAIEEIIPDEQRLVFKGWKGQQGLISPRISGVVSEAVNLEAVYDLEYHVLVEAPYGSSGGGWYPSGSLVRITVPESVQSRMVFKKSFTGFGDRVARGTSVEVLVDGPITITALYSDGVNTGVLALFLLLPLAAVLLFFGNRWAFMLLRRRV